MFDNNDPRNVNRYQSVILTARRARELNEGINIPEGMEREKITEIALYEMEEGKLKYTDEELAEDARLAAEKQK